MFVIGPAQGTAFAGDDWRILGEAGRVAIAGGNPYAVDLFRWNPLMAWIMAGVTSAMLFSMWTALHVASLFLLPRRIGIIALLTWPFWFDLGVGNLLVFVFIAAYWAYHGNRPATIAFMVLALLMPRPLMLPLLVWLLWKEPWTRRWFAGILIVIGAATLATGLAPEFISRLLSSGSEAGYVLNLAPSRWIGPLWFPVALGIGIWLTWKGRIGWAAIAIQPYLIPNYLIMALLELAHPNDHDTGAARAAR